MLPAIIAALVMARTGAHAKGMRARGACDTVASAERGTGVINLVAPGADGRVAWTDTRTHDVAGSVWVRGTDGHARPIGRPGAGPGEFRNASAVVWHGDTVAITDPSQHRVQRFLANGTLIDTRSTPGGSNFLLLSDGSFVGGDMVPPPHPKGPFKADVGGLALAIVRVVHGAATADTLIEIVPVPHVDRHALPQLEQPSRLAHSADGGFWCAMAAAASGVQISCTTSAGKVLFHGIHDIAPLPIGDAQWSSAVDEESASDGAPRNEVLRMFHRPVTPASAYAIFVNRNGDIWLQRSVPAGGAVRWDRMRQSGSPLPSLTLPARHQLRALDGAYYYAADTDADGLQTLIRCPIP